MPAEPSNYRALYEFYSVFTIVEFGNTEAHGDLQLCVVEVDRQVLNCLAKTFS